MSSLKERILKQKKEIKDKSDGGKIKFIKEGTLRARPVPTGEEKDFAKQVDFIYLNKELGGFISPSTWGEKCAFQQKYVKMNASKDPDDREFAKKLRARPKYLMLHLIYKDEHGNTPEGVKLIILTSKQYNEITEWYLDEKEGGDFTDPLNGYDIKYKREGKGMMDTVYTQFPCRPTKLPKEFRKVYDLDAAIREITPTYEETKELLERFMAGGSDEPAKEEEVPVKKKKKKSRDL